MNGWILTAAGLAAAGLFLVRTRTAIACATAVAGWGVYVLWQGGVLEQTRGFLVAAVLGVLAWLLTPSRQRRGQREAAGQSDQDEQPATPVRAKPLKGPGFTAVAGMADLKAKLLEAAQEAMQRGGAQVRNGILLHGDPGNGKTFLIEALAQELKMPLISLTYGEVASQWVGETTKNIMPLIAKARASAPCVLFFDEADSLLERRSDGGGRAGGGRDMDRTTTALLTEIVRLRGSGVVLVAATNFLDKLDPAATREGRFDFKIEVTSPDEPARLGLLQSGLRRHANGVKIPDAVVLSAAKRWKGFSVKRILAVAEQVPSYVKRTGKRELVYDDLKAVLREVQGAKAGAPEGTKSLDELVLLPEQRRVLKALATRLQNSFEIEEAGGSLPTGLLFSGPPGTGKTETARSLAKASGYAFLAAAGNDLIGDPGKIDKLYRDAMNLRPAIVFVDEADDLLADRANSPYKSVTNKFLTIMDGASGRIPDILYVAATNHPDALDSAATRGGRFTEKVEFSPPDAEAMTPWVAEWLKSKGWRSELEAHEIARALDGQAMANVAAVLQQAVNEALTQSTDFSARVLTGAHLDRAARTVLG